MSILHYMTQAGRQWIRSLNSPLRVLAVLCLTCAFLAAFLAPLTGYEIGSDVHPSIALSPISWSHPLGTDHLGRDVFFRLIFACQTFVFPGLLSCLVTLIVSIPIAGVSGFYGHRMDRWFRTPLAILGTFPRFVLILLCCAIFPNTPWVLAIAVGVAYSPTLVDALSARIYSIRKEQYVEANIAHGLPIWRVVWIHIILISCGRHIVRHLMLLFGYYLTIESTLSYIGGFGIQEPYPSWGNMLAFDWGWSNEILLGSWAPFVLLVLMISAIHWLSDSLQESPHG